MGGRTIAIGDIHGDLAALERLLARLPRLHADDTLLFIGDYLDRGPDPRGVVDRVRALQAEGTSRVVALRGNHEAMWLDCLDDDPDIGFLLPVGNGCGNTYRSFTGGAPLPPDEILPPDELRVMLDAKAWFPEDVAAWMRELPLWHEDDHAIYVHAALEGRPGAWKHPRDSSPEPLLWSRRNDFLCGYEGKRVVFGHTPVAELPIDHIGPIRRLFDDPRDVWVRGDLIGIDTGCGKGGFLSAVELPAKKVYESR